MNTFLNEMKEDFNYDLTENGAITHRSTLNKVLDMFAMGGAYRHRSEDDVITLFSNAYNADPVLALKCLFYIRDCRGGQGERRFFRVAYRWLIQHDIEAAARNLDQIAEFGRFDDLIYIALDTELEQAALEIIANQLREDMKTQYPSICAKWCPSENASAKATKKAGARLRTFMGMTSREYRKMLSTLRERINIVERLMSENRWDEIEFDKLPSRAGIIYKDAFMRRNLIAEKYKEFAKSEKTVNASVLYPHEVAHQAFACRESNPDGTDRRMIQKYWDALPNYYGDNEENGIAVVDVSGSMSGLPMEAAVSLGAYIAEKAHGPFAGHFITFSGNPQLVEFKGGDITAKFKNCVQADWGMNTNLEAVFDMLLANARKINVAVEDMPERIYIFSDMEFDDCVTSGEASSDRWGWGESLNRGGVDTLMETMAKKWASYGYKLPSVVFWNLDARSNNIPAIGEGFSYVSGFSPVMIQTILGGKDRLDLMLEKLGSERYASIQ